MTKKILPSGLKPKNPVWMSRVAKAVVHFLCQKKRAVGIGHAYPVRPNTQNTISAICKSLFSTLKIFFRSNQPIDGCSSAKKLFKCCKSGCDFPYTYQQIKEALHDNSSKQKLLDYY